MDRRAVSLARPLTRTPGDAAGAGPVLVSTTETFAVAGDADAGDMMKFKAESLRIPDVTFVLPAMIALTPNPGGRFSILTRYSAVGPVTTIVEAGSGASVRVPLLVFVSRMSRKPFGENTGVLPPPS